MRTTQYFSIAFFLILLSSCTEEVPFDLNEQGFDRLVVDGSFTDQQKKHEIKLTKTTSYFNEQSPERVSGAEVTISNALETWTLTEDPVGSGRYYTPEDASGTVNMNHELTIIHDGETYTAVDYMNPTAVLDSIDVRLVEYETSEEEEEEGIADIEWEVFIWTTERAGTEDYIRWRTLVNGVTKSDTIRNSSFANDVGFDGTVIEDIGIDYYDTAFVHVGDLVTVEQHGISEAYYDMLLAVVEQTLSQGGLFDPPPANVPTNLSNGALGFFSVSSVSEQSIVVQE